MSPRSPLFVAPIPKEPPELSPGTKAPRGLAPFGTFYEGTWYWRYMVGDKLCSVSNSLGHTGFGLKDSRFAEGRSLWLFPEAVGPDREDWQHDL